MLYLLSDRQNSVDTIKKSYRLLASFMALLMFTTSVGFSVDMHFCQGQLKSFNLFGKAKACHEMVRNSPMPNCPHHQKMMEQMEGCSKGKKGCCENKTLHFQFDQDQRVQNYEFVVSRQFKHFVTAFVAVFFNNIYIEKDLHSFAHYKPPLIQQDIPILIQSFLL